MGLRNGTLVVEVADGGAASLLRFQLPSLRRRLNRRFGDGTVADVTLRVRRPAIGEGRPTHGAER
jgi:hypothetical protein